MIKLWFLMALMTYPTAPTIMYKGFYVYETLEACEKNKITTENFIMDTEMKRSRKPFYVDTYCLEMYVFPEQIEEFKKYKDKKLGLGT
jgi:hypothetical protein